MRVAGARWWEVAWAVPLGIVLIGVFVAFVWAFIGQLVGPMILDFLHDSRYFSHRRREQKHWRHRAQLIERGAGKDNPERYQDRLDKHHFKALQYREKARRWGEYREAISNARHARGKISYPIQVDWSEPTPEEIYARSLKITDPPFLNEMERSGVKLRPVEPPS